jgi:hypothetical protein
MAVEPSTRGGTKRRDPIETKPFYATSEFMVLVGMTVALFISSLVVTTWTRASPGFSASV